MDDQLLSGRSVALVHEWFAATGGSENVFRSIAGLFPHAERYVLWKDHDALIEGPPVRESWMARTPLRRAKPIALPLMPLAWRTLSRSRFEVVISSSHAFAHTVKFGPSKDTRYLSYVHSPARYIWSPAFDGRGSSSMLSVPRKVLQRLDVGLSRHVHSYAVNSQEIRGRVLRYWQRDAHVINPPVDVDYFADAPASDRLQGRSYLLGVGRWIPYKKFDLIIEIADAAGLPLVIAGSGPQEAKLRQRARRARVPVRFEVRPDRDALRRLYWGAQALLFPAHEDFGIIPVEAQACGVPVVGLRRGGLLETVIEGETGFLIDSANPAAYVGAIARLHELKQAAIQSNAFRFAHPVFMNNVARWVADTTR